MLRFFAIAVVLGVGCSEPLAELGDAERSDIYGGDDRHEVYEFPQGSPQRRAADATAALLVFPGGIGSARDLRVVRGEDIGKERSWCEGVRFYEQPSMGSCTGFLVGPNLLATAGHCVDETTCADLAVVFDYSYDSSRDEGLDGEIVEFPKRNVYTCAEVLVHDYQPGGQCTSDYALLRLDRSVSGRTPLKVATVIPERGQKLFTYAQPIALQPR